MKAKLWYQVHMKDYIYLELRRNYRKRSTWKIAKKSYLKRERKNALLNLLYSRKINTKVFLKYWL